MGLPIFPPADFDAVIDAYGKGAVVNLPLLVYFDFRDSPQSYWPGEYDLVSGGVTWRGIGKSGVLVNVEGLGDTGNLEASEVTLAISGLEQSVAALFGSEDRADYVSRLCGIYMQFCDNNWQPLCPPYAVYAGFMGDAHASRSQEADEKGNVRVTRSITLPVSNLFYGRGNAPASFNTDRDQKLRFPGDRFMEFVPTIQETTIPVPWH